MAPGGPFSPRGIMVTPGSCPLFLRFHFPCELIPRQRLSEDPAHCDIEPLAIVQTLVIVTEGFLIPISRDHEQGVHGDASPPHLADR
jgi:hypothetical protein